MMSIAPESFDMELLKVAGIPMFNEDLEANSPKEWVTFKEKFSAVDGLLFFSPEYNRSVPAVLKNNNL